MKITEPTRIMRDLTARPTRTGFVSVDLGYNADPIAFTPDVIATEREGLPGWRWRKEYEREWDAQAGQPVFDNAWLDIQAERIVNPIQTAAWDAEATSHDIEPISNLSPSIVEREHGPIKLFKLPNEQPASLPEGATRVTRACGIGIDVGEGVGQSDSTIQVFFADNYEQAAEYASSSVRPADLGRIAVALAKLYNDALICCVRKMHGITVLRTIMDDCGYAHVWRTKPTDKDMELDSKSYGWPGGEASSPYLFGKWVDAMQYDATILHGLTTLQQHRQYIYDEDGRIVHQAIATLPVNVREKHGDLVIACALAYRACLDMPKYTAERKKKIKPYSFEWRAERARIKKERSEWD